MTRTPNPNKLPLSVTSFAQMIAQNKIYVDKTDLVAEIAGANGPVFLSRPRRFGKSTLVNTFHELFANGLASFKGLKIDKQNLWDDPKTYKVLHLDFSLSKEHIQGESFADTLRLRIKKALADINFTMGDDRNAVFAFENAVSSFPDQSLVLLVDEYDAPLTQVMNDPDEFNNRRSLLSSFFLTVKSYAVKFRFIFITGVTRFSEVSIFSAFNNIDDITFNSQYGAVTGYTQEELEHFFNDYISHAAGVLNQTEHTDEYTYDRVLSELKAHYDGYCFDEDHQYEVYNPWSILKFLKYPGRGFKSYWLESGGAAPSLLMNYLNNYVAHSLTPKDLESYLDLDGIKSVSISKLSPVIESIDKIHYPFEAILYQAGCLTIKDAGGWGLDIGIPNLEVKQAFAGIIMHKLTHRDGDDLKALYWRQFNRALADRDYAALKEIFNQFLNEFSYVGIENFNEAAFRDVIKAFLVLMGGNAYSEYPTAAGRSDLCLSTDRALFVFEFKLTADPAQTSAKLQEAAAQIKSRKYAVRMSGQQVIALAAVIVNEKAKQGAAAPVREMAILEPVS